MSYSFAFVALLAAFVCIKAALELPGYLVVYTFLGCFIALGAIAYVEGKA